MVGCLALGEPKQDEEISHSLCANTQGSRQEMANQQWTVGWGQGPSHKQLWLSFFWPWQQNRVTVGQGWQDAARDIRQSFGPVWIFMHRQDPLPCFHLGKENSINKISVINQTCRLPLPPVWLVSWLQSSAFECRAHFVLSDLTSFHNLNWVIDLCSPGWALQ